MSKWFGYTGGTLPAPKGHKPPGAKHMVDIDDVIEYLEKQADAAETEGRLRVADAYDLVAHRITEKFKPKEAD